MCERVSRRRVLAGSITLVAAGLAGCSDDGDDDGTATDDSGDGVGGGY